MREKMMKIIYRIKKRFLIASIVAIIYFWGVWATSGLIFGYLFAKYLSAPMEKMRGKMPSLKLSLGKYRLHFHHWLVTTSCLVALKISGVFDLNSFLFWVGGGIVLQGVLCYSDWYRIIGRK